MTIIQIIDNVRALLAEPLDSARSFPDNTSSFWKDSDLNTYINNEQRIIANYLVQSYENYFVTSTSIDIVQDQKEYSVPADFKKALRLENFENSSSPRSIMPLGFNDLSEERVCINSSANGTVQAYAIKGNSFVFSPRPGKTQASGVKVHYIKQLSEYNSASSVSEIPPEFQELLVWGTVKRALFQQEATGESYVAAVNEYSRLLRELQRHSEDRQIQKPRRVKFRRII